jgi:hypothetical protein
VVGLAGPRARANDEERRGERRPAKTSNREACRVGVNGRERERDKREPCAHDTLREGVRRCGSHHLDGVAKANIRRWWRRENFGSYASSRFARFTSSGLRGGRRK